MAQRSHFGSTRVLVAAITLPLVAGMARAQVACEGVVILGTPDDSVYALHTIPNGDIVAAGEFNGFDGAATGPIARWNGTQWASIGTNGPTQGPVRTIAPTSDGFVVAGQFRMGPDNELHQVARWNGVSWTPLDAALPYPTPQDGPWMSGAFSSNMIELPNGSLVAASNTAGSSMKISLWNGTTWSIIGETSVSTWIDFLAQPPLAVLPNGDLVLAGKFESINGVVVNNVARWDGTTWHPIGTGLPGPVTALHLERDGTLVAASNVYENPLARFHIWNGSVWQNGTFDAGPRVYAIKQHPTGVLLATGVNTNSFQYLNINQWEPVGSSIQSFAMTFARDGGVILAGGFNSNFSIRRYSGCFCPADLSSAFLDGFRDGAVTIDDLLHYLVAFEQGASAADLDNDGDAEFGEPDAAVTIDDLLFFLARFEAGC